jgi:ATP-dependent Clp protease ATP-binding subunit ClpC
VINEHSPFTHFDSRAKRVMVLAWQKAENLNSQAVFPEHLLLAVLSVPQGSAARAVTAVCGSCATAEDVIAEGLRTGPQPSPAHIPFTPAGKEAIVEAARQANLREDHHIGTGHLLLGLLRAGGEPLTGRLSSIGVTYQAISDEIGRHRHDS